MFYIIISVLCSVIVVCTLKLQKDCLTTLAQVSLRAWGPYRSPGNF